MLFGCKCKHFGMLCVAGKGPVKNGQGKYSTRASTGRLKKKRYSVDGFYTDVKTESDSHSNQSSKSHRDSSSGSSTDSSGSSSDSSSPKSSDSDSISPHVSRHQSTSKSSVKPRLKAGPINSVVSASASNSESANNKNNSSKTRRFRSQNQSKSGTSGRCKNVRSSTRNHGKQRVSYQDDSDDEMRQSTDEDGDEQDEELNMSSRGRVRKMTARARASLLGR